MNSTLIEAELPAEFAAQARSFVAEGWAADFTSRGAVAAPGIARNVADGIVCESVQWGLHGRV